jgi:RNA polymerase sigma factor (sigma-70 family)
MDDRSGLLGDFGAFYRAHLDVVLAFCMARVRDPELAADLAAEVFAAALIGRRRYRPDRGTERQWLLGIAANKVADARRRGVVERRAQQRLGMAAIEFSEEDYERVAARADGEEVVRLLGTLPIDQRDMVQAHVVEEQGYDELALAYGVKEATVRKRVSRGLAALRGMVAREDR